MSDYRISNDEFDYMLELIVTVLFMAIGIVGIVFMVNQFNRQVQLNPRVDKVRVSSIDQEEGDPFDFTAYQAYMMAWMMDGHDKTALYYFADKSNYEAYTAENPGTTGFPRSGGYIGLCPAEYANGFIVLRNRAIIGSQEYGSHNGLNGSGVKNIIYAAYNGNESDVEHAYRGDFGNCWRLEFTDKHVGYDTQEFLENTSYLFEERKDYIWSLHQCSHDSP